MIFSARGFKTILYDLDGTLIDHFEVIVACCQYAMRACGVKEASFAHIKGTIGGSITCALAKLISPEKAEEATAYFRKHFAQIWKTGLYPMRGAKELLRAAHEAGFKQAIFTNKAAPAARDVADFLGFTPFLDGVFGTLETPWKKPEPAFTAHVLKRLGAQAEHALMVGDSDFDFETAQNAGLACVLVATGTRERAHLESLGARAVYPDLRAFAADFMSLRI